jgi:APA family basic amino acid/polyamine antiporter
MCTSAAPMDRAWDFSADGRLLTIGFGAAIAAGAVSFAAYGLQLVPCEDEGGLCSTALALALLWAITGVHLAGVGAGGALQRTLTVLKVGAILVLIAAGLMVGTGDWAHLRVTDAQVAPGFGPWCVALIFALYAYSGWNAAAYLAGEITEPARTIPRTMIGGTLCVGSRTSGLRIMFRALSRSVCVVCISRS